MSNINRWLVSNGNNLSYQLFLTVVASFAGKALGFVRLQQIAYNMGTSEISDALIIVLQLVWFIEITLVSGAVAPMLIAKIYQLDITGGEKLSLNFFSHNLIICLIISILFSFLIIIFANPIVDVLFQNSSNENKLTYVSMIYIGAAFPLILSISHFSAMLNRLLNNGVWYSIPQIIINLIAIIALNVGLAVGNESTGAIFMMSGLSIGGIIVCFIQFLVAPKSARDKLVQNLLKRNFQNIKFNGVPRYWGAVFTLLVIAFMNEIFVYIDFYFASSLEGGSISAIGYASRTATLTNMLFVATLFVILEPRWAKYIAEKSSTMWGSIISNDIICIIGFTLAPFAFVYIYTSEVTDIVYGSSKYLAEDQLRLNGLTKIFSISIIGLCLQTVSTRSIILTGNQSMMMYIVCSLIPIKIILNIILIDLYGVYGLAISSVIVIFLHSFGNFVLLNFYKTGIQIKFHDLVKLITNLIVITLIAFATKTFFTTSLFFIFAGMIVLFIINILMGLFLGMRYTNFLKT